MKKEFNSNGIPAELKEVKQWVLWKIVRVGTELVKMPHSYRWNEQKQDYDVFWAKTTEPEHWLTYEDAVSSYLDSVDSRGNREFDGVGFIFTEKDPYVFVDLDDALDEEGKITDAAEQVLGMFDTWAEVSQSGKGLHIICKTDRYTKQQFSRSRKDKSKKEGKYEMYTQRRFCAMTGHAVDDVLEVRDCTEALKWFYKNFIETGAILTISGRSQRVPTTVEEVIELLRRERTGKFSMLFDDGDVSEYGDDESAADMALATKIAFYTQDPDLVESVFDESALANRDKWQKRQDYRDRTIDKAIQGVLDSCEWYLSGLVAEEERLKDLHAEVGYMRIDETVLGGEEVLFMYDRPHKDEKVARGKLIPVGHRANITTVVAQSGWGKSSAIVGSIVSAVAAKHKGLPFLKASSWGIDVLEGNQVDSLGFRVAESVNRILVFDTEQDKSDGIRIFRQGVSYRTQNAYDYYEHPDWLTCVPAIGYRSPTDIYNRLEHELQTAEELGQPFDIVIIDMVADLIDTINDEKSSIELVGNLRQLATRHDAHIVCTAHMNPKVSNTKAAGWLGTILVRRSKTVFTISKSTRKLIDYDDFSLPSYKLTTEDGFIGKNRGGPHATTYYQWWVPQYDKYRERGFMATYQPDKEDNFNSAGKSKTAIE